MPNAPITDTNALCLARLKQLLQCQIDLLPFLSSHAWSMYQEQIHVSVLAIDFLDTVEHLLVVLIDAIGWAKDLGRDEYIGALQA
jgi:hypothetical protein